MRMLGLYAKYTFNFIRNCQTIFPSGWTTWNFHKNVLEFKFLYILAHTWYDQFFSLSISNKYAVIYNVVLICISLMTNDVEHHFIYFFAIHIFLWWSDYSDVLPIFIGLFVLLLLLFRCSFMFWMCLLSDIWFENILLTENFWRAIGLLQKPTIKGW